MKGQEEAVEKLKLIGLSEYAAKAYIAIVKMGEGTAPDIAKVAKIPKAKIYEVLEDLNEKGFVGKKLNEKPVSYFAYRPLERFREWLKQFEDLSIFLEEIYNTVSESAEKGYYVLGNFEGKLKSDEFLYVFEQNGSLFEKYFTGSKKNYYQVGGKNECLVAIGKKKLVLLNNKNSKTQLISLEGDIFYQIIDLLMLMAPINRTISQTMVNLAHGEPILYTDTILAASGIIFGKNGKFWITPNRIFIKFPEKNVYARPIDSIKQCKVLPTGAIYIEIIRKDGEKEIAEIFTYSDPRFIENIINIIKTRK